MTIAFTTAHWPTRLREQALTDGYDWSVGEIAGACGEIVGRHGIEKVEHAWNYWTKNAARFADNPKYISPIYFARTVGYWIQQSAPAHG